MPSLRSAIVRQEIRLIRPILKQMNIEAERRAQDALGKLGARALEGRIEYVPERFSHFPAEWARPASAPEPGAVLYLHGGSYTAGGLDYAKGFGGVLADAIQRETLCIGYRLAPEHPFPAALDDAETAYCRVIEQYPPERVAVAGESAGGGLLFALLLRLKAKGRPMPGCAVALSPWADLRCQSESFTANAAADICLFGDALRDSAGLYARGDVLNPFVSPVLGDFGGCPPTLIFAGTDELLLDDSRALARALLRDGVSAELHVEEGMWHVYCIYGIPEAQKAIRRIDEFIDENC